MLEDFKYFDALFYVELKVISLDEIYYYSFVQRNITEASIIHIKL